MLVQMLVRRIFHARRVSVSPQFLAKCQTSIDFGKSLLYVYHIYIYIYINYVSIYLLQLI